MVTWADPWPSAQPSWCDPPWVMRGRVVTGWFDLPWAVVEAVLSPDLAPPRARFVRSRLRFYDLTFEAIGECPGSALAPRHGRFREGAIGVAARHGPVQGDSSVFLWTDSDIYLMWGREAFGWPVRLAEISLRGALWADGGLGRGGEGEAALRDQWGTAALRDVRALRPAEQAPVGSGGECWLTPQRVLRQAGCAGESRQLLVVRPTVRDPGTRYAGEGQVTFSFAQGHPLGDFCEGQAAVDVVDGIELVVGEDVSVAEL
jgi:Acetoacetate decarboxylase (ADC)